MKKYVVGVDLGGTKIAVASSDLDGNVIYENTIATNASEGESAILNRIITLIDEVIKKSKIKTEDIVCIGIGSPGPLDSEKGVIITTPNLPFKNFQIVNPIREKFNIPVVLDNDANVAALGEHRFGAGRGTSNMIFITVSTGIGAGAILNGKLYRGNTGNALEIGHVTLKEDGPKCNCGNYGCAEVMCSGTAIARQGKEAVHKNMETSLKKYENITAKDVFNEAELGDSVASSIIDESLNFLGIFVANVLNCFDPEVVVIGGGVSKAGKIVFDKINEVASKRSFKHIYDNAKILPAELGTDAGIKGALALAISSIVE
ncbi:ROK family protein [Clostridium sp. cel8]|jgi:glucokinase|uniref:ROK family protein n=1 Tax=unclassified Clostridium TaxID=2614128 RepID=UPI0015F6D1A7|nr:ROK family protein [Clostridium sp. cel8]MBA5852027.1 ROK family protein [Clostridium sp. cel8]